MPALVGILLYFDKKIDILKLVYWVQYAVNGTKYTLIAV